ncbi:hypothetical protein, partial [Streptomyces sp. NPDC086010]|uniref:hypothetical protein n=1 Tax=Streptomyces sp. NPDC086010 TaxID=3365745 RepID=UPI0037CF5EF2
VIEGLQDGSESLRKILRDKKNVSLAQAFLSTPLLFAAVRRQPDLLSWLEADADRVERAVADPEFHAQLSGDNHFYEWYKKSASLRAAISVFPDLVNLFQRNPHALQVAYSHTNFLFRDHTGMQVRDAVITAWPLSYAAKSRNPKEAQDFLHRLRDDTLRKRLTDLPPMLQAVMAVTDERLADLDELTPSDVQALTGVPGLLNTLLWPHHLNKSGELLALARNTILLDALRDHPTLVAWAFGHPMRWPAVSHVPQLVRLVAALPETQRPVLEAPAVLDVLRRRPQLVDTLLNDENVRGLVMSSRMLRGVLFPPASPGQAGRQPSDALQRSDRLFDQLLASPSSAQALT